MKKYVYWLKNKTTGLKYIGSKYGRNSNPDTFWVNYFTSSKHIKKLRDLFGDDDFEYKILKTFDNEFETLKYENALNKCAFKRSDYLNLHYNFISEEMSEDEYLKTKEKQQKIASVYGNLSYLLKNGIHSYNQEEKKEIASKGGQDPAEINKKLGRAIFDPSVRKRQHKTLKEKQVSAYYDPILRKEICSKGGKSSGQFQNKEFQSQMGKRGGVKNKGFIWYNDGSNSFKYTIKMQQELDIDVFLKNNSKFSLGRTKMGKRNWYNDGVKNYFLALDDKRRDTLIRGRAPEDKGKYDGHKNKNN